MKIAVFGAGYVGCVTAASLASLGHTVWLVEVSESKRLMLESGECPIVEPGIDQILPDQIRKRKVIPLASSERAVAATDLALICVGTPSLPDGTTDTRQVRSVFSEILAALQHRQAAYTLALRSTLPYPYIASDLLPELQRALPDRYGKTVHFALNPEFLREGSAMKDFLHPPFVVIGTEDAQAEARLRTLYRDIRAPFHVVSIGSASLLKYACNAFHALKIVFTNEMASLSLLFHADAQHMMDLFCQDHILNISSAYLRPGFAYGGSCLSKDVKTLGRLSATAGLSTPLIDSIEESNRRLIEKTIQTISEFGARKIGLIGLTFKAGTDDFRNSPLVELAERLIGKGFELAIYDPDVELKKVHGQNLRYIELKMRHLAQSLKLDFKSVAAASELLIIGKSLPDLSKWIQDVPGDRWILDLTRRLPIRRNKPVIVQIESLTNTSLDQPVTISSGMRKK